MTWPKLASLSALSTCSAHPGDRRANRALAAPLIGDQPCKRFPNSNSSDALNAQSSDLATLQSLVMGLYLWIRDSHGQASVDAAFQRAREEARQFRQQSGNQADERLILQLAEIVREQP